MSLSMSFSVFGILDPSMSLSMFGSEPIRVLQIQRPNKSVPLTELQEVTKGCMKEWQLPRSEGASYAELPRRTTWTLARQEEWRCNEWPLDPSRSGEWLWSASWAGLLDFCQSCSPERVFSGVPCFSWKLATKKLLFSELVWRIFNGACWRS